MVPETPRTAPRRSAFAAAFFSLLLPGLGHLYLGRWMRGLAWAVLPVLVIALGGGLLVNASTRATVETWVLDPFANTLLLAFLVLDLVYRVLALADAWRLARTPGSPAGALAASVAGLLAVLVTLGASHLAVAAPLLTARDLFEAISSTEDDGPIGSLDPSVFGVDRPYSPPPMPSMAAGETAPPAPTAAPTPSQGPSWTDGGELNILLIGADSGRRDYSGYLTDTMILVRIDTKTKQTAFISLPRDTQNLPIPADWDAYQYYGGFYPNKANTIYTWSSAVAPGLFPGDKKNKGFDTLKAMLAYLYGLPRIDYFVAVDLRSFRQVVDDLGGVMIDVQNPVYDYHYPADDGSGHIKLYIPPGLQFMQGQEALAYSRARHVTSDFDRSARQQRVITSVREQLDLSSLLAPGVLKELLRTFKDSVKTDIPADKIPALIQLGQQIDLDKRISLVLDPPEYSTTCYPCPPDGMYVLKANVDRIRRDVQNIFKADKADAQRAAKLAAEGAVVHVLNGTKGSNLWTTRLADYLDAKGLAAIVPPVNAGKADREDYTDTVIVAYNGAESAMPETVAALEELLNVRVTTASDPAQEADFVVVNGSGSPRLRP